MLPENLPDAERGHMAPGRWTAASDVDEVHECLQTSKLVGALCFESKHPPDKSTDVHLLGSSIGVHSSDLLVLVQI
jgi:hypothetical protein